MGVLVGLLVAVVVLGVAGVGAYVVLRMRWQSASAGELYLHFRCPGCKRRLRFRAKQAGHSGQCSHCGNKLIFPAAAQASD
jgi:hypothetical protein